MPLYAPPAIPWPAAGYAPLHTDMEGWIQSPLGFQTQGIMFRGQQSVSQSIGLSPAYSNLVFTALEDPYGGWNGTTTWTAPYTGWYQVTLTCSVQAVSASLQVAIDVTGTRYITTQVQTPPAASGGACAFARLALVGGVDSVIGQASASVAASTDVATYGRRPSLEISFLSQ